MSPQRASQAPGTREADQVEELVEAHMVFVDLAGTQTSMLHLSALAWLVPLHAAIFALHRITACLWKTYDPNEFTMHA